MGCLISRPAGTKSTGRIVLRNYGVIHWLSLECQAISQKSKIASRKS